MARFEENRVAALRQSDVVRVTIPAEVAFDLDHFQKTVGSLAEKLGCKSCLSGAACFFDFQHTFRVTPQGELLGDPDPQPNLIAILRGVS